jgi:Family of unknown function (DUF5762)
MEGEAIWYVDPLHFLSPTNFHVIIPHATMTTEQQLNAVLRFALYFSVIVVIVKEDINGIFFVLLVAGITALLYSATTEKKTARKEVFDQMNVEKDRGAICTKPSTDNPFMNTLASDPPSKPGACDVTNVRTAKSMDDIFDIGHLPDDSDLFDRKSSRRQFYTVPSCNDGNGFAKWLYGDVQKFDASKHM